MVMVFTYYRIYVVASKQTRSLKLGVKQIEMSGMGENSGTQGMIDSTGFTLRMHRGGASGATPVIPNNNNYSCPCQQHLGGRCHDPLKSISSTSTSDGYAGGALRHLKSNTMDQIAKKSSIGSDNVCDCDTSMDTNVHPTNNKVDNRSKHKTGRSSLGVHSSLVDVNNIHPQTGGRHARNYKASNWSVGKRLAKLAKGK